jgi:phospholipase/lecithinase/hemolysin
MTFDFLIYLINSGVFNNNLALLFQFIILVSSQNAANNSAPVVIPPVNPAAFSGLYVFGDSLSDYGSRVAEFQRYLFAPDASPAWSGVTFSNGQTNWQTLLSETLDLQPGSLTNQQDLPADPYYLYANELVSPTALASETTDGTSYAMGGATSGYSTLYQYTQPVLAKQLQIENLGVAAQISAALGVQAVRLNSSDFAVVWAGGNDLLVAFGAQKSLSDTLNQLVVQLRNDLETVLRFGDARHAMLTAISPLSGVVNAVKYQAPFLSGLILAGSSPTAPEYLKEWVNEYNEGIVDEFRANIEAMVAEVQKAFPYVNLFNFNPEYQAQYEQFGSELGDFASYGIDNTLGFAQSPVGRGEKPVVNTERFLYFDNLHPTSSGHSMLAKAIELELDSVSKRIAAATLTNTIESSAAVVVGSIANDLIIGKGARQDLLGEFGNDRLISGGSNVLLSGGVGNDLLQGGAGEQYFRGGLNADFFGFTEADAQPGVIDRILDFTAIEGDRIGINAVLGITNSLAGQGWTYIDSANFNGVAGELRFANGLLQGDTDGNRIANLQIQLDGISTFSPSWIS